MIFLFLVFFFGLLALSLTMFFPVSASAVWTPLINASDFTGIQTDVLTAGTGILAVCVIILGVFMIVKAMSH